MLKNGYQLTIDQTGPSSWSWTLRQVSIATGAPELLVVECSEHIFSTMGAACANAARVLSICDAASAA